MTSTVACSRCGGPSRTDVLQRLGGVCLSCMAGILFEGADPHAPSAASPLTPGERFRGLEIGEQIGAGGMGVVVKAVHLELGRPVALKLLAPRFAQDAGAAARFLREAQALAKLDHPGIVKVHDFGREGELCYLVMEFAEGTPLRQLLAAGRLPPERAMKIVSRICAALEYAHHHGIVHRDIKPENILVGSGDSVKVADFGLAKAVRGDLAGDITEEDRVWGTPRYMAPEQYQKAPPDPRSDIYSLGVVFYEMLTGEVPMGRFDPPSRRSPVDRRLDGIVLKALARDPARRFQRVGQFRARIEGLARGSLRPGWKPMVVIAVLALAAAIWWAVRGDGFEPVTSWNRGAVAADFEQPAYSDGPLAEFSADAEPLGRSFTVRFDLRYEAGPGQEPWILFVTPETSNALFIFPEGDHTAALAVRHPDRGWGLREKHALPEGRPRSGGWSRIEIRATAQDISVAIDGLSPIRFAKSPPEFRGAWRLAFGGAATSVRVRKAEARISD